MMNFQNILFFVFAAILVLSAIRVITAKNPVHAALFLVLAFFNASCLWMMLKAEFLSISLVLVYVGAVMVLFLFVVMMLDINLDEMRRGFWRHAIVGLPVGGIIAAEMSYILFRGFVVNEPALNVNLPPQNNTQALGELLYSDYIYAVEIAAVILLVAIVAAIALTLRQRKDSKFNNPSEQIAVRKQDRIRIVKMQAEKEVAADTESVDAEKSAGSAS